VGVEVVVLVIVVVVGFFWIVCVVFGVVDCVGFGGE